MSRWSAGSDLEVAVPPVVLSVDDASQVGEARRNASAFCLTAGFDVAFVGRVALVVTEAATNLTRHGRGGTLLLRIVDDGAGIEILCVDRGPGMADPARCVADGFSTAGTAGKGLGAIKRIASAFDLWSVPGGGTVVLARLLGPRQHNEDESPELGVVSLPAPGERIGGDTWAAERDDGVLRVCVADGLGHGPLAYEAASRATAVFRANARDTPAESLQRMHLALRPTRGAAIAVAHLERETRQLRYVGVGNIAGLVLSRDRNHSLMSHNGTVGHEVRRVQEVTVPWTPASLLLMHSDGLQTRWRPDQYPNVLDHHPAILAALLHRDFTRGRDDVTVLALRESPAGRGTA